MIVLKFILKLIFNLFPIFLMTVGRTESYALAVLNIFHINVEETTVSKFMLFCFIVGVLAIYMYYPLRYEILNRKIRKQKEKLKEVTKELRNIFSKNLGKEIKLHGLQLNIRKFNKIKFYEKPLKYWLKFDKVYFKQKNYEFLTNSGKPEDFSFQVSPIPRGLVGVAYVKKKTMYDDKLSERMDEFNLNNNHKNNNVIANTDFAIIKPFVSKKGNIRSMIAFDTEQEVTIPTDKKKEVGRLILYYSDLFGKLLVNID